MDFLEPLNFFAPETKLCRLIENVSYQELFASLVTEAIDKPTAKRTDIYPHEQQ